MQPKQPSFRRKPESRKSPGKERAGYGGFWIPAFAGTTVLDTIAFLLRPAQDERGGQIRPLCRYSLHLFGIIIRVGAGFKPARRSMARTYRKPSMPGLTFLAPEPGRVTNPPLPANHLPGWCKVRNPLMVSLSNRPYPPLSPLNPPRRRVAVGGDGQAQVAVEGGGLVLGAEQAPFLQ